MPIERRCSCLYVLLTFVSTMTFYRSFTHIQSIISHVNVYLITRFFRKLKLERKNLFPYFVRIFSRGIVLFGRTLYIFCVEAFSLHLLYISRLKEKSGFLMWGYRKTKKGERYLGSVISSVKDTEKTHNGVPTEKKIGLRDPFKVWLVKCNVVCL